MCVYLLDFMELLKISKKPRNLDNYKNIHDFQDVLFSKKSYKNKTIDNT